MGDDIDSDVTDDGNVVHDADHDHDYDCDGGGKLPTNDNSNDIDDDVTVLCVANGDVLGGSTLLINTFGSDNNYDIKVGEGEGEGMDVDTGGGGTRGEDETTRITMTRMRRRRDVLREGMMKRRWKPEYLFGSAPSSSLPYPSWRG